MSKITYANKTALNENTGVADANKVNASDMNEIKSVVNENTPVGSILLYSGSTAPNGWLICDGSAVSRTTYADLFTIIGTTFGSGDGSTTFNLPNLKGKIPVGYDSTQTEFDTLGETGGNKNAYTFIRPGINAYHVNTGTGAYGDKLIMSSTSNTSESETLENINNLQPYIVMNYIISY